MLNTVSGLSSALLDPAVPTPVPKPLLKSNPAPHIKKLSEAPGVSAPPWQGHLCLPVLGTLGCLPQWRWLPHAPHTWHGAMRDRALCRGLQGNMETEVGELGGNSHWQRWGSQDGPGWPVPRARGSPSLGTHVSSSVCSFLGEWADREAAAQSLHQRLSPMEPQLPGEAPGPRWAAAAARARATSQPWEPLPGTSLAFPTSSQPLLGAKQLPVTLPPAATALAASRSLCSRESTWHAKGDSGCRGHGAPAGSGCVCSSCPLPGSCLCELLCGVSPPAVTGLLVFSSRRG